MIITITGKIASGKTTVAKEFAKQRCHIISVDELAHIVLRDKLIAKQIIKSFGKEVANREKINRTKLGQIVFSDIKSRKKLEKIVHPVLKRAIKKMIKLGKMNVIDAALFYELGLDKLSDYVIVVKTSQKSALIRCKLPYNDAVIKKIYKSQRIPKKYDYIILNRRRDTLRKRVNEIYLEIKNAEQS